MEGGRNGRENEMEMKRKEEGKEKASKDGRKEEE